MRKITLALAICALVATGCSKDTASVDVKSNPDQINFRTNTTRASIVDLAALEASTVGFVVYGTSADVPAAWYSGIDGTNNYKKIVDRWAWTGTAPLWPLDPAGYPMNFYAYYASSYTGFSLTPAVATPTALSATYVIQAEASQVDLLAAKATAAAQPASSALSLEFTHTLSKINFGVIPGNTTTVHLQSININNVANTRIYDFITGDWTAQPTVFTSSYLYKKTVPTATPLTGTDAAEIAVKDVVATNSNLMLMPQLATTWTPASGVAPANAYIGVIYRLQTPTNTKAIGYLNADEHPLFNTLTPAEKLALASKPLFVKVGYPFAPTSMTWDKGKGYIYNLKIGTVNATNGYITDIYYYDENGNPTPLKIENKSVGEAISDGTINFTISVTNWANQAATIIP